MKTNGSVERPVYSIRPYGGRGFTLIEVLVSLAIFAMAAIVLATAYVNLLMGYEMVRRGDPLADDLVWVRRAMLAEPDRDEAETGGDVVLPDDRTARWTSTIEPTEVSDLFDVILTVEIPPKDGGDMVRVEESHRLLRPTWSEPAEREKIIQAARQRLEASRARQ